MGVTLVVRGEEWISSVPLHHQLFDALGFPRIPYAHVAPLMKQDGGSRRKLSKRRDPEASVNYYIEQGIPAEAVHVLPARPRQRAARRAAAARGAGRAAPAGGVRRGRAAARHGQAGRRQRRLRGHAVRRGDPRAGAAVGRRVRQGPRGGSPGGPGPGAAGAARSSGRAPRTRARTCASGRTSARCTGSSSPRSSSSSPTRPTSGSTACRLSSCARWRPGSRPATSRRARTWPGSSRSASLAGKLGFALRQKDYKKNPDAYPGSIADAAAVIRVLITGSRQSPDLEQVADALGRDEVLRRVTALG